MKFGIPSGIRLYCMTCEKSVDTLVENGEKIYPNRPDLADHVFLMCPNCHNYVSADQLRPHDSFVKWKHRHDKKVIPTKACRKYRQLVHQIIDPLWKEGVFQRNYIYKRLSEATGTNYHNSSLNDVEVAEKAYAEACKLRREAEALTGRKFKATTRIRKV